MIISTWEMTHRAGAKTLPVSTYELRFNIMMCSRSSFWFSNVYYYLLGGIYLLTFFFSKTRVHYYVRIRTTQAYRITWKIKAIPFAYVHMGLERAQHMKYGFTQSLIDSFQAKT